MAGLQAAKLKALIPLASPGFAASAGNPEFGVVDDGRAYVLAESIRSLGPALYWAATKGQKALTLFADDALAGHLARRAAFVAPDVAVWSYRLADGKPEAEPAEPAERIVAPSLPAAHEAMRPLIEQAGALAVDDYGRLVAEVLGLEVARVIDAEDEFEADARLEVGVGLADRELQAYIHGALSDAANLARVVEAVGEHRQPGAAVHPLARIGRQRWLRAMLIAEPSLVDAPDLVPLAPLRPSDTVLSEAPAAAASADGSVVAVCQVGVDLDLVPEALDYRSLFPQARLVIVVPERDRALLDARLGFLTDQDPSVTVASPNVPWG